MGMGMGVSRQDRERDLVSLMRPSESVLETLQRLGVEEKKRKQKQKAKSHAGYVMIISHCPATLAYSRNATSGNPRRARLEAALRLIRTTRWRWTRLMPMVRSS